jgi:hypothetical protein
MKASELTHGKDPLFEVSMRPSYLEQIASQTGAMAGIEFEMYVPDVITSAGLTPMRDILEYDGPDIDGIIMFFSSGENVNSRKRLQRLEDYLRKEYREWLIDAYHTSQDDDGLLENIKEFVDSEHFIDTKKEEIRDQIEADRAIQPDMFRDEDAELEYIQSRTEKMLEEYTQSILDEIANSKLDGEHSDIISDILDEFSNSYAGSEENFLAKTYGTAQSINYEQHGIEWPLEDTGGYGGDIVPSEDDLTEVGYSFKQMIGRRVNISTRYHGARRAPGEYALEPDSSLSSPMDVGDYGLEFISPALPLQEMISDLKKVVKWATRRGCYTNSDTGLHINISIPSITDVKSIDYVKLVLLLGDDYVAELFDRHDITYAKSSYNKIVRNIRNTNEAQIEDYLEDLRNGLQKSAADLIHRPSTSKYTSVNVKSDGGRPYIEFRSPGGDWLNYDIDGPTGIVSIMNRFVLALHASADTELFKEDYLKKMYKILKRDKSYVPDEYVSFYSKVLAGFMPRSAAKSFIRNLRHSRMTFPDTKTIQSTRYIGDTATQNPQPTDI